MSKFSERLRILRTSSNLSQAELARAIGTTKSSVNMYERGEREPGIDRLEAFADYFNVDMDYLLGKSDIRNRNIPASSRRITAESSDALDLQLKDVDFALYGETKDLTDAQKRDVLRFVQFIKQQNDKK